MVSYKVFKWGFNRGIKKCLKRIFAEAFKRPSHKACKKSLYWALFGSVRALLRRPFQEAHKAFQGRCTRTYMMLFRCFLKVSFLKGFLGPQSAIYMALYRVF